MNYKHKILRKAQDFGGPVLDPSDPDLVSVNGEMIDRREAEKRMQEKNRKMDKARAAIQREDSVCFDVAAEYGQMFENVKHMKWFVRAVADELS